MKPEPVETEENVDKGSSFGHVGKLDVGLLSNTTDAILLKDVEIRLERVDPSKYENAVNAAHAVIEEICENVVEKVLHGVGNSAELVDSKEVASVLKTTESDQVRIWLNTYQGRPCPFLFENLVELLKRIQARIAQLVAYRLGTGEVPTSNPNKGENFSMKISN